MALHNPHSPNDSSIGLSVRDWPESEQPRERLFNCGPDSLSDAELLAIFLRVGVKGMTVMDLSRALLKQFQGFRGLFKASHQELQAVSGLRPAKVATLKALAAVTVRYLAEEMQRGPFIGHSRDVQRLLCGRFRDRDREVFAVVFLDTRHHVLAVEEMFQGTLNSATVFPREIVRRALQLNAAAMVAVHNHPSGNPSPSPDDRQVTWELQRVRGLLDILLLDHIAIGGNDCFSFAEHRLLCSRASPTLQDVAKFRTTPENATDRLTELQVRISPGQLPRPASWRSLPGQGSKHLVLNPADGVWCVMSFQ